MFKSFECICNFLVIASFAFGTLTVYCIGGYEKAFGPGLRPFFCSIFGAVEDSPPCEGYQNALG
jgi:hypothetical protein